MIFTLSAKSYDRSILFVLGFYITYLNDSQSASEMDTGTSHGPSKTETQEAREVEHREMAARLVPDLAEFFI
ncbi:hypothetical protein K439DRAFT_1629115 [Ramaria rubella]|nr:hypothetical protein K439DRAFT_1629115 [Ramaria rubella]